MRSRIALIIILGWISVYGQSARKPEFDVASVRLASTENEEAFRRSYIPTLDVAPGAALELARTVAALPRLKLRGLMAIPPATEDQARQRGYFAAVREIRNGLIAAGVALYTLSMGMSALTMRATELPSPDDT